MKNKQNASYAALKIGDEQVAVIPGYKAYEYLLVLTPHEALRHKIMELKKDFYDKYKASAALFYKPHVTLASFRQYELTESRITNRLRIIAMGFKPVKIEMRDYGSFPSHTIFINVVSKLPIQNLVKQIRTEAQKLMKFDDEHKPYFIMDPHITLARKLQPWQYEKGWLEYRHKHFTGRFIADAMLLLKRPVGAIKYEIAARFAFENLDVGVAQGALF